MTTIITRLYKDQKAADAVAAKLADAGFPDNLYETIGKGDDTEGRITAASVNASDAATYAPMVDGGNALVVVRAPFTPFGAAKAAMGIVDAGDPIEVEGTNANDHQGIDPDAERMATKIRHGFWADFWIDHLVPGHKFMAKWPFDHLVPGHKFMAKFPFDHLVPGHKFMAKFPFDHLVPGHKFMAKFPFAHIVPGHKFMAKFPFDHIVPGHKYMANWIWPHTKEKSG